MGKGKRSGQEKKIRRRMMAGSSGNHQPLPQSTGHGFRVRNDARHVGRVSNDIDVSLLEVSVVHAAVVVCAFVSSYASFPSGSAVTGGSVPRSSGEFRKEKNGTVAHELYVTPPPPHPTVNRSVRRFHGFCERCHLEARGIE